MILVITKLGRVTTPTQIFIKYSHQTKENTIDYGTNEHVVISENGFYKPLRKL